MPENYRSLLLDEYVFTFLITFLSIVFKAATTRRGFIFRARETYDLGLEFTFIALSFALSGLSNLYQLQENAQQRYTQLLELQKQYQIDKGDFTRLEELAAQLSRMTTGLWIVTGLVSLALILMVIMLRQYHAPEGSKYATLRNLVIPNILGFISVVLVLIFTYEIQH
jgi:hypothetical protein